MNEFNDADRNEIMRIRTVCKTVGLSRATLYRYMEMNPPIFPRSIKIGIAAVGWRRGAIMDFLDEREAESKQVQSVH